MKVTLAASLSSMWAICKSVIELVDPLMKELAELHTILRVLTLRAIHKDIMIITCKQGAFINLYVLQAVSSKRDRD